MYINTLSLLIIFYVIYLISNIKNKIHICTKLYTNPRDNKYISVIKNVFTKDECKEIIRVGEEYAKNMDGKRKDMIIIQQ